MPLYNVKIKEIHVAEVDVQANSVEEAIEEATKLYNDNDLEPTFYELMDDSDWEVEKADEE